ncbi:hypothetical protein [Candidatus Pelagibacter sp. HIMB1506]|uniref:hypothetical protein n=1 Tax=Candidatus Pelagibacter sp. HIMB1506 TaxID=3413337 RepID=UPI003F862714
MRKIILITLISIILIPTKSFSKEVNLSCDLSSFFIKKNFVTDEVKIPLDKVKPHYLEKVTIKFDMEKEKFLGSNLIYQDEFRDVLFSEEEIYFLTKGIDDDHFAFYDTRLNRLTGQLTRITQPTKSLIKEQLKNTDGPTDGGFKQTEIYQCKVIDKLF